MGMTAAGWLFLALAWTFIFGLVIFCFRKIFDGSRNLEPDD